MINIIQNITQTCNIDIIIKNYQSNFSVAKPLVSILGDCPFDVSASFLSIKCQLSSSVVTNCLSLSK